MKVGVIGFNTLSTMPYAQGYLSVLRELQMDYDLICWDRTRNGQTQREGNNIIIMKTSDESMRDKFFGFLHWHREMKKILRHNAYDKLIVLTTVPAVLLHRYLKKKYDNNYILDIRDYTFEQVTAYRKIVEKRIAGSRYTSISSPGFFHFLSESPKIRISHNLPDQYRQYQQQYRRRPHEKIRIHYLGIITYLDVNQKLIHCLKNDDRIELIYQGQMAEKGRLEKFVNENGIRNVQLKGKYPDDQKPWLYGDCDWINAVYSTSIQSRYLIPNKLYDALLYRIPLLVTEGTTMAEIVRHHHLGLVFDPENPDKEQLIQQMRSFDFPQFYASADHMLNEVCDQVQKLREELIAYLKES